MEEIQAFEVANEDAVAKVPLYDNGIALYTNSETFFENATGDYGYHSLSASQQTFYASMETALRNFQNSDSAEFIEVPLSGGKVGYTPFRVDFSEANLTKEQVSQVWTAFRADHPWLYWLGGYMTGSSDFMPSVVDEYKKDIEAKRSMDAIIENGAQEYIKEADGINDTFEKVRVI